MLSKNEHEKLVENVKLIFDYLKTHIVPNIEREIKFNISNKINFFIYPCEKHCFTIVRTDSASKYIMREDISSFISEKDSTDTQIMYDITYDDDLMLNLIKNWSELKLICTKAVSEDSQLRKLINNFKV